MLGQDSAVVVSGSRTAVGATSDTAVATFSFSPAMSQHEDDVAT